MAPEQMTIYSQKNANLKDGIFLISQLSYCILRESYADRKNN